MSEYLVTGGRPLSGIIKIGGAKNAALKLMAASLLTDEEVTLDNVPLIEDVYTMAEALKSLGADVQIGQNCVTIKADNLTSCTAPYHLVSKMRASILVMGPLLAKQGRSKAAMPGGCRIGLRKIDFHIKGLEALGAQISLEHGYIDARAKHLTGCQFQLDFPSVGATENLLMAAVLAKGKTTIKNAAREPELTDLVNFLKMLGARIKGAGTSTLTIEGVKKLKGGTYNVMPDRIETGTFLAAGAICGNGLKISQCKPGDLSMALMKLKEIGAQINIEKDCITITKSKLIKPSDLVTLPYPGFATDLQGPFMALLSIAKGNSVITENVFEGRFLLAEQLNKMGANIEIQGHHALIKGNSKLNGCVVEASDLRGGAALVLAGLVAEGVTNVLNVHHIDRGYENFEQKLNSVGANIKRVDKTLDLLDGEHQLSLNR